MAGCDLAWYNSVDIFHKLDARTDMPRATTGSNWDDYCNMPGHDTFKHLFNFFAFNMSITDRTGILQIPVKTVVLPECRMPEFQTVTYDYSELCEQRARFLLDHAIATNRKLVIMYSGGIDSTLILVSLLKISTLKELKNHVIVLLSDLSIQENPIFYKDYISKLFVMDSSYLLHNYLGNDRYVVVNGEGNDQLFGSAVADSISQIFGMDYVFSSYSTDKIIDIMQAKIPDRVALEKIVNNLNRLIAAAPIELPSIYHYFWWINFALKWQSVYMRSMAFTTPKYALSVKPLVNYFSFFITPEMQLWAMNNPHMLIKNTWASYKFHCKDIIYNFNRDADYRDNKVKVGSLAFLVNTKPIGKAIDSNDNLYYDNFPEDIWNNNNDFI